MPKCLLHIAMILFFAAAPHWVSAQQETINFRHLGVEDGLSLSKVYCIIQDSMGFTWIGTEYGLNRYDGYRVERYRSDGNPRTALSHDSISGLFEDDQKRLWIGTYGAGIDIFDLKTERISHLRYDADNPDGPASGRIKDFLQEEDGGMWVATYNGLDYYDEASGVFTHYKPNPKDPNSISTRIVRDLHLDSAGRFWVATTNGGLNRFYPESGRFEHFRHDPKNPTSLNSDSIKCIYEDVKGRIWLGTTAGLALFHPESGTFTRYLTKPDHSSGRANERVYGIAGDGRGMLWVGTLGGGLYRFNPETGRFFRVRNDPSNPNSLSENRVRAVFIDPNDMLWVGTYAGVDLHPLIIDRFKHYRHDPFDPQSLSSNAVRALCKGRDGDIWVGTYRGGINRLIRDGEGHSRFQHFQHNPKDPNSLSSENIYDLVQDQEGFIWAAGDEGLNRLDPNTGAVKHYLHDPNNPESLNQNRLRSLYLDREGYLWVGTYSGGLHQKIDDTRFRRYTSNSNDPDSLISNQVRAILQDEEGRMLVGTFRGFDRLEHDGRFTHFPHDPLDPNSIAHDQVHALAADDNGSIWIATFGGLSRMDGDRFTSWTVHEGLPSDLILGVVVAPNGNIWASTGYGLSRLDLTTGLFRNYDMLDGLQNNEFSLGAFGIGADGELLFGGVNGFNTFYPNDLVKDSHPPKVHLTNLLLENQAVPLGKSDNPSGFALDQPLHHTSKLVLSHREYFVTFEFSAIHYADPMQNRYAYMMEGLDETWIETDAANRRATYTRLDPGRYRFKVKGANPEGVWSSEDAVVDVIVTPPPWRTWWAYTLYALVVLLLLFFFQRGQANKLAREREINRRLDLMVQDRTASLQRRHDELEGLDRIVKIINREIGLERVLETMLVQGLAMFGQADKGLFLLRQEGGHWYHPAAAFGFENDQLSRLVLSTDDLYQVESARVRVLEQDVLLINPDHENPTSGALALGLPQSVLVMSLVLDQVVEGYLLLCNYEDVGAFDQTDAQRLDRFREHAVSALAKARLLQELQFKNEEILRAQDQLILQEKMSSMGLLTAGIAHELKNPLNFINNFSDVAIDLTEELNEVLEEGREAGVDHEEVVQIMADLKTNVAKIGEHGRRANEVIMSMMNLAGGATSKPAPADLSRIITEALDLAREGARDKMGQVAVAFNTRLEAGVGTAPVHGGDLRRVLINLITNAIDALLLKKSMVPDFQPTINVNGKGDESWVEITIEDNGPGISKEHQNRIFTPFFTTKTCDSGNVGLGLSLCYDIIVREHHGDLSVTSTPGELTRFTIRLPRE